MNLAIICVAKSRLAEAEACASQCGLTIKDSVSAENDYALIFSESDVRLRNNRQSHGDVWVDFCGGSAAHRRRFGGGKSQLIAKAVGIKGKLRPQVHDLTAGLGRDSFALASLGCEVTMLERNPVVHALLADGLSRAHAFALEKDQELLPVIERMQLIPGDAVEWLRLKREPIQVIYLDPMFPERRKSANVKKEMQAFHQLVGTDPDEEELLRAALAAVENRVVVKRPRTAPSIGQLAPSYRLEGKSSRYDIYAMKKLTD